MKRLLLPLLLLAGLLAFPSVALNAARDAAALWWHKVFPALLPFMLCCNLLEKFSIFRSPFSIAAIGALSGYPAGAKLLGGLQRRGRLTPETGQRMALFANLCSPGFLLSVVAIGLYGNWRIFFPLFLPGLLMALAVFVKVESGKRKVESGKRKVESLGKNCSAVLNSNKVESGKRKVESLGKNRSAVLNSNKKVFSENPPELSTFHFQLSTAIFDATLSLLRIGGCIVACAVFSALLFALRLPELLAFLLPLPAELIRILLGGMVEMTWGAGALAASALSLRLQLALSCFFVTFGGLSVWLQSLCFMRMRSPARYLLHKLLMGLAAGALAYLLTPLFVPDTVRATLSQSQRYATNAAATGSILAISAVSLLFAMLLGVVLRPKKEWRVESAECRVNERTADAVQDIVFLRPL